MIIRNQLRSDGRLLTWRVAETVEERSRAGMSIERVRISRHRREQLEAAEYRAAAADEEIRTGVKARLRVIQLTHTKREAEGAGVESLNPRKRSEDKGIKEVHAFRSRRR